MRRGSDLLRFEIGGSSVLRSSDDDEVGGDEPNVDEVDLARLAEGLA